MYLDDLRREYDLLDELSFTSDRTIRNPSLRNHSPKLLTQLVDAGYIASRQDGVFRVTPSGASRLCELRSLISQIQLVDDRLQQINLVLEHSRQEFADYKSRQRDQYMADSSQSIRDHNQILRHNYFVTGVGCALTFLLDHASDLISFLNRVIEHIFP